MKADDIITYCIDNYGYVECINLPYGQELQYCQGGINVFFFSILEFDTEDDTFSSLNQPDKYRLSLCLSKEEYNLNKGLTIAPQNGYEDYAPNKKYKIYGKTKQK